jgi:hypothetical protein
VTPQLPQFDASVAASTQTPPHCKVPSRHETPDASFGLPSPLEQAEAQAAIQNKAASRRMVLPTRVGSPETLSAFSL